MSWRTPRLVLVTVACWAFPLASQQRIDPDAVPRPVLAALQMDDVITLDGVLTEEVWFRADSTSPFFQAIPVDGMPATEQTVVRVLYDDDNLYIGAILYDSEPGRVTIPGLEQDFRTENSDMFGVAIDTYLDRANAFLFAVNPGGAVFDAQNFNDSRYTNRAWEGVIHVRTARREDGWSTELIIPFTTLRFRGAEAAQDWGINFLRRIRRKGEDTYWAPLARQYRVHKMSRAGTLTGLTGLRQGRNLTVKPYVTASRQTGSMALNTGSDGDAGVDVKYGVTSRLTLDLSINTDFSQVEVDQEQINLTRFSLFFPEQRDFFLENDGIFSFGDVQARNYRTGSSNRNYRLFHSRRIGLSSTRQALPIAGGGRLTGRIGDTELGFLNMQTRTSGADPAENFAVARVRHSVASNADVGFMLVNRQGTASGITDQYNRAYGLDANVQIASKLLINAYAATTDEPGETGNDQAGWIQLAFRDRIWDASAFVRHIGDGFNPGTGFVRRGSIRSAFATGGAHPQPPIRGVREFNPYVDFRVVGDLDWNLESRNAKAGLAVHFVPGDVLTLEVTDNFERLTAPDMIAGITIAAGDYEFQDVAVIYRASGARPIAGDLRFSRGGFYGGTRTSLGGRLVVRPSHHLQLDATFERNALEVGGFDTTADLIGGRVRFAGSTRMFGSAFMQYNRTTDEVITNVRFNLIHAPLSDVFVVLTDRRGNGQTLDRVVAFKVTRLFGF